MSIYILRLLGIYRLNKIFLGKNKYGEYCAVVKEGHYFSRIHVDYICLAIIKSINNSIFGETYNVSDNEPASNNIVQQFRASALNKEKFK